MIKEAIAKLIKKENLTTEMMEQVMEEIMIGEATDAQKASFLTAMTMKGETIDEITSAAKVMRSHCEKFLNDMDVLEIVGTGGDGANTINISTIASIIVSSTKIPVAKHGNRAASSKCGTADCLEALGVNINISPAESAILLKEHNMCFLFAQKYHPAMRFVGSVRREIGIRTIFNVLGPLANPAGASMQLLGVYSEALVEPLARVLYNLGVKRAMVVYGQDGMDEISLSAPTTVCEVRNGSFAIKPEEAAVVRRIFQMYLEGMGSVKIMKLLTEEGVPAPLGGLWNASVVMEMLKNEKYAGDLLLQKFYTNNHVEKKRFHNRGELPQYFVGEDHEPIIDRETFDAVQREIALRTARRKADKAKRAAQEAAAVVPSGIEPTPSSGHTEREAIPLTDRIYCGICGKKYRYKVTRLGTPYAAPVWICSTFNYRGKAYCASKQIPEDILKELIASALGTVYTEDSVHHIEMHPGNRVLFVFQDGHTEERFWKDHSRKDSWNEEKRQKAAEKTRIQHQKRKEQEQ